jgi:hypothetical protein
MEIDRRFNHKNFLMPTKPAYENSSQMFENDLHFNNAIRKQSPFIHSANVPQYGIIDKFKDWVAGKPTISKISAKPVSMSDFHANMSSPYLQDRIDRYWNKFQKGHKHVRHTPLKRPNLRANFFNDLGNKIRSVFKRGKGRKGGKIKKRSCAKSRK